MGKFQVGDVVKLKSGGPNMTVEGTIPGWSHVVWFESATLHRGAFREEHLKKGEQTSNSK
ncbi:MAG: YodC family protein [Planctomycetota bacterium]|jgi:uncharacterized protein YodC (DUF2158 family)